MTTSLNQTSLDTDINLEQLFELVPDQESLEEREQRVRDRYDGETPHDDLPETDYELIYHLGQACGVSTLLRKSVSEDGMTLSALFMYQHDSRYMAGPSTILKCDYRSIDNNWTPYSAKDVSDNIFIHLAQSGIAEATKDVFTFEPMSSSDSVFDSEEAIWALLRTEPPIWLTNYLSTDILQVIELYCRSAKMRRDSRCVCKLCGSVTSTFILFEDDQSSTLRLYFQKVGPKYTIGPQGIQFDATQLRVCSCVLSKERQAIVQAHHDGQIDWTQVHQRLATLGQIA
jgi:hypothetical protein